MKVKSKFCFLLILFAFMFLLVFNTECFAAVIGFNGGSYSLPSDVEDFEHYVILESSEFPSHYIVYLFNESLEINKGEDGSLTLVGGGDGGKYYRYDYNPGSWGTYDYIGPYTLSGDLGYYVAGCCDCMMQYKDDFTNDNFFGRPLQVKQGILPPIIQVIPLKGVLKEIVAILPVVLATIVGLIGLRKALAFLLTALRRS